MVWAGKIVGHVSKAVSFAWEMLIKSISNPSKHRYIALNRSSIIYSTIMSSSSNAFASLALLAISSAPLFASAFSPAQSYRSNYQVSSSTSTGLNYRSLHHGPDIQPLTDIDRMGSSVTKMDKDRINNYGPGDFNEYVDHERTDLFDGGDSEMGIFGDGNNGLQKFGCDVTPHMTRTLTAKSDEGTLPASTMSYTDELLQSNPGMDTVRAQQLKNWANQREISMSNNYSYMNQQYQEEQYMPEYAYDNYEVRTHHMNLLVIYYTCTLNHHLIHHIVHTSTTHDHIG